jgi:Protein phosphatase 2C
MPCQDYAMSGGGKDFGAAIISDGCSSGGKTDVGARIIAHSTAIALAITPRLEERGVDFNCRWADLRAKEALCLKHGDMLATCAYVAAQGNIVMSRIIGDGVAAGIDRIGRLFMNKIDWAKNTPVYRAYEAMDRYESFVSAHGGLGAQAITQHVHVRSGVLDEMIHHNTVEYALNGVCVDHDPSMFTFLAVFSDGVAQVDGMDWRDVVAELMNFKSTEGDFVKRRMNRFLKDCLKYGKGPIDDISMACIHIDHEAD